MANPPTPAISVSLDLRIRPGEPILARLQFANVGAQPYRLLSWLTFPGGRIDTKNYFKVTVNDRPAAYTGIMKKRGEATAADYLVVAPGETLTSVVSLSDAYAIARPSLLTVVYSAANPSLEAGAPADRLVSNTVSIRLP